MSNGSQSLWTILNMVYRSLLHLMWLYLHNTKWTLNQIVYIASRTVNSRILSKNIQLTPLSHDTNVKIQNWLYVYLSSSSAIKLFRTSKSIEIVDCPYEWQLGALKIWPLGPSVSRHKQEVNMLTTCKKCLDLFDLVRIYTKYHLEACCPHTICSPNNLQTLPHNSAMPYHTKQQKKGFHSPSIGNDYKIVTNFDLNSFAFNIIICVRIF